MKNKLILAILAVVIILAGSIFYFKNKVDSVACPPAPITARNPATGEIMNFASVCAVPDGWDKLENGGNDSYIQDGVTFQRYRNSDFGISFAYKVSPDGYTLVEKKTDEVGEQSLQKFMSLFNTKEYTEFKAADVPREGPPTISILIFNNPQNVHADVWVRDHARVANYREGTRLDKIDLAGTSGVTYQADGLYQDDVVILENNYKIYMLIGSYISPQDTIRNDYYDFLNSLILF